MELGEAADLGALLHELAERHGMAPAVSDERSSLSFADLDRRASVWAGALRAAVGVAGRVGLLAANGSEWLAIAFGAWRAGAVLVPLSTFATERELAEMIAHADLDLLITQPRLGTHDYVARLAGAARGRRIVTLAAPAPAAWTTAERFLASRSTGSDEVDPAAPACILYTSGTTGAAKGVCLSHRAVLATTRPTAQRSGLDAADNLLSTLPLFWVAGLIIRALPTLAAGCELRLVETFSAAGVVAAMRCRRPTALHLRPPQVGAILSHPDFAPELLAEVRKGNGRVDWFAPYLTPERASFITGYGMTEMAGYVTALDWRDPIEVRQGAALGTALPGVEVRIADERGKPCDEGTTGEIRVRGPGMFSGYRGQAPGTGIDESGFFRTGDLGRMERGRLYFVGRTKDLLRVKGINVSPVEVESVLAQHPAVENAYVVGLPAEGLEQQVVALVVVRGGRPLPEEDLRRLAAATLSHYKRPEIYIAVERCEIPLGATSKPRRQLLGEIAATRLHGAADKC
jgi:acyl-CoA synthetase (AMP-forming)/AMP-acid ligase II